MYAGQIEMEPFRVLGRIFSEYYQMDMTVNSKFMATTSLPKIVYMIFIMI